MRSKIFCCIIFSLSLISCDDSDFEETTRIVPLEPFHALELNSVFDVYLLQDTSFGLRIAGRDKVVDDIRFDVKDDTLRISNGNKRKWLNPADNKVKLVVSADLLHSIVVNESCYIKTINPVVANDFRIINHPTPKLCQFDIELDNKSFYYWNNFQCGGNVRFSGRTDRFDAYIFALMTMDASQLVSEYAFIQNSSRGDCEINVQQQLEYSILDVGNIYLHGNPSEIILKKRTSTGNLIQLN